MPIAVKFHEDTRFTVPIPNKVGKPYPVTIQKGVHFLCDGKVHITAWHDSGSFGRKSITETVELDALYGLKDVFDVIAGEPTAPREAPDALV